jgi:hypothetical protein
MIAADPGNIEAALLAFQEKMIPRSARSSIEGYQSFERTFGYNAPDNLREMVKQVQAAIADPEKTPATAGRPADAAHALMGGYAPGRS